MCKDKGQACAGCRHNGETRDCPSFKQKASCVGCGATHYQKDMVFIDEHMYACEMCATQIVHGMEVNYVPERKAFRKR